MTTNIANVLKKFHRNEAGLEALQVVMIIAIAALFLIAVKFQWQTVLHPLVALAGPAHLPHAAG